MQIRELTINDYEEMTGLWVRAGLPFRPRGRDSREEIALQMQANPEFFLGAFENNRIVGVVIISCDGRKGWINRLAVDPDCRRRGIGKALIAESEKTLRKHGIRIFCAEVETLNNASRKLFNECGYVEHRDVIYFSKRDNDGV